MEVDQRKIIFLVDLYYTSLATPAIYYVYVTLFFNDILRTEVK